MPVALFGHLSDRQLGDVEEPGQVHGGDRGVVLERVLREGLADVETGVFDQRVDPPEAIESQVDRTVRGLSFGDVAGDGDAFAVVVRGRKRPGDADDGIAGAAVPLDETGADALRRAGDDRDRRAHVLTQGSWDAENSQAEGRWSVLIFTVPRAAGRRRCRTSRR